MTTLTRTVLVIDDEQVDREQITRWFSRTYALCEASTGRFGLDVARELRPACVILDHRLPDVRGLDILDELVASDIGVVYMTGKGDELTAAEAIKRGAVEYLPKGTVTRDALRVAIEQSIRRTVTLRQLREARQDREDLLAVASSDLQAPIDRILGVCRRLNETLEDEDGRALIAEARDSASHLSSMLEQLVSYVKVNDDATKYISVDLQEIVDEVVVLLDSKLAPCDGAVEYERLPVVQGIRSRILQLFRNLIEHAVDARVDGAPPHVRISARREDDIHRWRITLSFNGRAVPPEHRDEIFAPFGSTRASQPFELLLATCAKIVRQHDGRIWLDEASGDGCTFHFTLPCWRPAAVSR